MVALPADSRLKVEQEIEDKFIEGDLRPYLGLSGIADPCARKLWYAFRWCATEQIEARKHRLLSRGHREEPIILADLEAIGVKVNDTQQEFVAGHGHIMGHGDGELDNIPDAPKTTHLAEFKTANDKNFKKMKKLGLIDANPVYHGQMITYMYLGKYKRGLFIMVNKNDDERYYERVYPNSTLAKELIQKGIDIISTEVPPGKIGNASWYQCKWCKFYGVCHLGSDVLKTCRSCSFLDLCDNGIWKCSRYSNLELCTRQQKMACDNHDLMKILR